ncbi:MAG: cytochrome c3 family protein, partial [Syntrophales bacterium LBB04]|nr:cytochrome c3 family protein [Syntrophales bacterium LBB04]
MNRIRRRRIISNNHNARQIDLSTYDWIGGWGKLNPKSKTKSPACGWCHPGGGPLEYGRGANGGRNLSMNHTQAEQKNRSPLDGDYSSRLTPDRRSHFKESGVLEADCLICHLPGYRMDDRNQQINARNYRWAATAGAGFGQISGAVFTYRNPGAGPDHPQFMDGTWNLSKRPVVSYYWQNRSLFTGDGRLRGSLISKAVSSRNCQQCHRESDAKNVGALYDSQFDVHAQWQFQCTDCHGLVGRNAGERLRHQIAKGWSAHNTVRNDLDGAGMKTCVGCHIDGKYVPTRKGTPGTAKNPSMAHA